MVGSIALLSDGLRRFLWHSGRSDHAAASAMGNLFASHPPIGEQIARLRAMG